MPSKMPHPCKHPGCPALIRDGAYCPKHAPQVSADYEAQRGTAAQRGYGSRWRRFRGMYLREHPICVDPFGVHQGEGVVVAATDVDHITPRRAGGSDDDDNLQALCKSCHSRKTLEEQRDGEGGPKSLGARQTRPGGGFARERVPDRNLKNAGGE